MIVLFEYLILRVNDISRRLAYYPIMERAVSKYVPVKDDDNFNGIVCDLDDEDSSDQQASENLRAERDHTTRDFVVRTTMWSIIAALLFAGGYGLMIGDWSPLKNVWIVAAAPLGAIFARYIGNFDVNTTRSG